MTGFFSVITLESHPGYKYMWLLMPVMAGCLTSYYVKGTFLCSTKCLFDTIHWKFTTPLIVFLPSRSPPSSRSDTNAHDPLILLCEPSLILTMLFCLESNCLMRTLDSGIGTFPLPDSGNRSTGRYICHPDSPEDTEPILSLQPALCAASSIRAQTLEREVPSSADSQASADNAIVHSTSDPIMTARGMRPLESRLPKPASSGKMPMTFQIRLFPHQNNAFADQKKMENRQQKRFPPRGQSVTSAWWECGGVKIPVCPQTKSKKTRVKHHLLLVLRYGTYTHGNKRISPGLCMDIQTDEEKK